jgi:hypothetical protein
MKPFPSQTGSDMQGTPKWDGLLKMTMSVLLRALVFESFSCLVTEAAIPVGDIYNSYFIC